MMHLAFYRAGGTWFDKLTRIRTNGQHTHVELVFSPELGNARHAARGYGVSFSSSQWDGGTRFKDIEYDLEKWDLVPVNAVSGGPFPSAAFEGAVRAWCEGHVGLRYDWRGIIGFFAGRPDPGDKNRWFCSEACCAALQHGNVFSDLLPSSTSPEGLWIAAIARREVFSCDS